MNPIAEEILMHYGMPRRSGRYPWGSGENPYQHSGDFLSRIDELKSQGMSDTEIAKAMGLTTTQYRTQKSLAKDERRALDVARAKSLREDGLSSDVSIPYRKNTSRNRFPFISFNTSNLSIGNAFYKADMIRISVVRLI